MLCLMHKYVLTIILLILKIHQIAKVSRYMVLRNLLWDPLPIKPLSGARTHSYKSQEEGEPTIVV